jgi:hypothetical protein
MEKGKNIMERREFLGLSTAAIGVLIAGNNCLPLIIQFSARCRPLYTRRARDLLDPAYVGEYR